MGARKTGEGFDRVYAAAATWVEYALKADDSLFDPGKAIWTAAGLQELRKRFLDRPDYGSGGFYNQLRQQLEDSPPEVYQLMAEVLYAQFLIIWHTGMGAATKRQRVERVLGWGAPVQAIPDHLVEGLTPGIARSMTLTRHQPYHVAFIIEFVEQWKELPASERDRYLQDPWAFKEFASDLSFRGQLLKDSPNTPSAQREALLHLVHPDHFEGTVSVQQKETIAGASAFAHFLTESSTDVDARLAQIRRGLEEELGSDFDFYDQDEGGVSIWARWHPEADPWDEFVRQARQYLASGRLAEDELDYKLDTGGKLAAARRAVIQGADNWPALVKSSIGGNLIYYIVQAKFRDWIDEAPDDVRFALQKLWEEGEDDPGERIAAFCELLPDQRASGTGTRATLASVLLMGLDVEQFPPFRTTPFGKAYQQTGYGEPARGTSEAEVYEHALGFLDRFIEEASERELAIANRLEAQSLVWAIHDEETAAPVSLLDDEDVSLEELADELMWEPDRLRMVIHGLEDKGQVIFQGPPGTGKTFVAQRIAQWYQQRGGDYRIIQFHPSYTYEDFVEGFRPTLTETGQAGFELVPGPLRRIVDQAEANHDAKFILVIDEINRGNLAKILGELYFLLEYRDQEMLLQYSHQPFHLPRNLWFIGTMNTTDRSIALVDAALRRRFYFFGFYPDEPPVHGLLRRWLSRNAPEALWVADLVDAANRNLDDRHLGIGPSHFMKKDSPLDEPRVRFIWEQAVLPYIEEQFFGDENRLKEFDYGRLLSEIKGSAMAIDTDDGPPQDTSAGDDGQANDDGHDAAP